MIIIKNEEIVRLVEQAKSGNNDALSSLVELTQPALYRIVLKKNHNMTDSEDIVQLTYLKTIEKLPELKDNRCFFPWLCQTLKNTYKDFYKNKKNTEELLDVPDNSKDIDLIHSKIDFSNIIKPLSDEDKRVFELRFCDDLTIKKIAQKLNTNESTIKSKLGRGTVKVSKFIQPITAVFLLCILITSTVIGACIWSKIQDMFETRSVGVKNIGIEMAIENKQWFQETDMDYIDLGSGNKLRIEYLLMDEMNLYFIFDFQSENDISKFSEISLPDLKITNENGDIICDKTNMFCEQYMRKIGDKLIENDAHHMQSLVYMYTDNFPISHTLNISFSKVAISKKLKLKETFDANIDLQIDLAEKFINRNNTHYLSEDNSIKKAIITETGFYAVANLDYSGKSTKAILIDTYGNTYDCYTASLTTTFTHSELEWIILTPFFDTNSKDLKLVIDDIQYDLIQK